MRLKEEYRNTIVIQKSRFIACLAPCRSEEEARSYIASIRKEFPDATHVCTAYAIGETIRRSSDNKEPAGTAGVPMLEAILKSEVNDVCACVVRYFGGIKLGAGGLVRAYSKSVMEAIGEAEILEIEEYDVYNLIFEYSNIKIADSEVRNNNLEVIDKDYTDKVSYDVVSKDNRDILKIFEKYSGKISVNFKNKQFLEK